MSNLWKNRTSPQPLKFGEFDEPTTSEIFNGEANSGLKDQKVWSLADCGKVFENSVNALKETIGKLASDDHLVWDKDDNDGMDFVASCANIRAHIFSIIKKSRFDIKSMAGNIIPAIATTNAITAGIVVNRAFKVLQGRFDQCQSVYIRLRPNPRNQIFIPDRNLNPPNLACAVCSNCKPEVTLKINTKSATIKDLKEVLLEKLTMETPEIILDGKGIIVVSSEEDEATLNDDKILEELGIVDGCVLKVDDFDQNFEIRIIVIQGDKIDVQIDENLLIAAKEKNKTEETIATQENAETEVDKQQPGTSTEPTIEDDDDDICIVEEESEESTVTDVIASISPKPDLKRKVDVVEVEEDDPPAPSKKPRFTESSDDDCMIVDDIVVID